MYSIHFRVTDRKAMYTERQTHSIKILGLVSTARLTAGTIIIIIISIRTKSTNTEKQLTQQYRL